MPPSPRSARPPKRMLRFHCGRYFARTIRREDASDRWAGWLADPWATHTLNTPPRNLQKSDIVDYIKQFDQRSKLLLGIFERGTRDHIGIVRVDLDYAASDAVVSVIVERGHRGRGVQANLFMATLDYLFETIGVATLRASILERNQVSMRYLLKAGWQVDEMPRQQIKSTADGSMLGVRSLSLTRDNWQAWKQTRLAQRLARRIGG